MPGACQMSVDCGDGMAVEPPAEEGVELSGLRRDDRHDRRDATGSDGGCGGGDG